ncbi:MAG: SOS response-associated peptidase, partial [Salinibacterium sp.]|nr:SOS response-associated peptidase [Salinibacterium sp.]
MCGRFVVTSPTAELVAAFDVQFVGENLPDPSWNIAPTQSVAVVVDSVSRDRAGQEPARRLEAARWGLVPSWAKDIAIGSKAFNARIETAAEKPMFRSALASHRAVVPASGYFEWRMTDNGKIPEYIFSTDGAPLAFAALYSWWRDPTFVGPAPREWILSTTILTRASTGA